MQGLSELVLKLPWIARAAAKYSHCVRKVEEMEQAIGFHDLPVIRCLSDHHHMRNPQISHDLGSIKLPTMTGADSA
jgi:hypothetical protein